MADDALSVLKDSLSSDGAIAGVLGTGALAGLYGGYHAANTAPNGKDESSSDRTKRIMKNALVYGLGGAGTAAALKGGWDLLTHPENFDGPLNIGANTGLAGTARAGVLGAAVGGAGGVVASVPGMVKNLAAAKGVAGDNLKNFLNRHLDALGVTSPSGGKHMVHTPEGAADFISKMDGYRTAKTGLSISDAQHAALKNALSAEGHVVHNAAPFFKFSPEVMTSAGMKQMEQRLARLHPSVRHVGKGGALGLGLGTLVGLLAEPALSYIQR